MTDTERSLHEQARQEFRDIVSVPIKGWYATPAARRTLERYRRITDIPTDLAAAGFTVAMTFDDGRWVIEVTKPVGEGMTLAWHGRAENFAAVLFQISEAFAEPLIDDPSGEPGSEEAA